MVLLQCIAAKHCFDDSDWLATDNLLMLFAIKSQAERARKQVDEAGAASGRGAKSSKRGAPKKALSGALVSRCVTALQALMQKHGAELFLTPVDKVSSIW